MEVRKMVNEKEIEENYGDNLENWGDLPNFKGGFINFGYWKDIALNQAISVENRIKSSENLYIYLANELNF